MANIYAGQGSVLWATIATVKTKIAQVLEIDGPSISADTKEITTLADTIKKYRAGLPDPGEMTFKIEMDPSDPTHQWLLSQTTLFPQPAVAWELDLGTSTHNFAFSAFLTAYAVTGMNQTDNLEADCTLKLNGAITPT